MLACGCVADTGLAPPEVPVVAAPELSRYREAAAGELAAIEWTEPAASGWKGTLEAQSAAERTIKEAGQRLAAVDYPALSLPDFVTYTRAYAPVPADFTGQGVEIDAYGASEGGKQRWTLYRWRGPELPPHPERPLVRRWIYVYALYDLEDVRVTRLLAIIQGEVQE